MVVVVISSSQGFHQLPVQQCVDAPFKRPPAFIIQKNASPWRREEGLFWRWRDGAIWTMWVEDLDLQLQSGERIKLQEVCLRGIDLIARQVSPRLADYNYKR